MPLIKSAKKQMRQSLKHRVRNYRVRTDLKLVIKEVMEVARHDKKEDAQKAVQKAYKIIDTAAKKGIIHSNNADRKKSHMARLIADMGQKKHDASATTKKSKAKKVVSQVDTEVEEASSPQEESAE